MVGGLACFWILPDRVETGGLVPQEQALVADSDSEEGRKETSVGSEPDLLRLVALPKSAADLEATFLADQPRFSHAFIEEGAVAEERIFATASRTVVRQRIMQTPQYPDPVFVEERYDFVLDGRWALESQKLEIANEWMLKIAPADTGVVDSVVVAEGATVVRSIDEIGLWTLRFEDDTIASRETRREKLERIAGIEEVLPNDIIWPTAAPNDPNYSTQWEFAFMEAEAAWDILTDATINDRVSVAAAIVDTGVNVDHVDLSAWVNPGEIAGNGRDDDGNGYKDDIHGYDFYSKNGNVQRTGGHGVNVAFVAGRVANNGVAKVSAAWNLDIMAAVCYSSSGAGSSSAANQAIFYAVNNGARVVNLSFVGGNSFTYKYSIDAAESAGVIVCAGAGNDNGQNLNNSPLYPVSTPNSNVVGVGATTSGDVRAGYSNYGSTAVDVFAPAPSNGTSFSTPVVTSIVSLLIADDPEASHTVIIDRLVRGVDKKDDLIGKSVSGGRVNMLKSLRLNTLRRPKDLVAYSLPEGGNRLFWTDQSTTETGFIVERSTTDPATVANPDDASQMSWQVTGSNVPANVTTFLDSNVSAGQTYFYRVRAKGASRNSARNHATRVTPISAEIPSNFQPSSAVELQALGQGTSILLDWSPSGDDLTRYVIERSENGGASYYILATLPAETTSYVDASVDAAMAYTYRIKSSSAAGGIYSSSKTLSSAVDSQSLWITSASNLNISAMDHRSVELAWGDESFGEAGYRIERALGAGPFETLATLAHDANAYVDPSVSYETSYRYRVVVFGGSFSRTSGEVRAEVPSLPYTLVEPVLSGEVANSFEVVLSWTDSSTNASGFRIERAPLGTGAYDLIATLSSSAREFRDTTAPQGSTVDYRVAVFVDSADIPSVGYDQKASPAVRLTTLSAYEDWSISAIGTTAASQAEDPDSDGWNNLSEYAVFTSPTSPQPFIALPGMSLDGRVTLSFARRWDPSVSYIVLVTGDLGATWIEAARLDQGENVWTMLVDGIDLTELGAGDRREVVVTDCHRPVAEAPRYMRLVVE